MIGAICQVLTSLVLVGVLFYPPTTPESREIFEAVSVLLMFASLIFLFTRIVDWYDERKRVGNLMPGPG